MEAYIIAIAISMAVLLFAVVVMLFSTKAKQNDIIRARLKDLENEVKHSYVIRDEELSKPLYERAVKPLFQKIYRFLSKFIPVANRSRNNDGKQKKQLEQAGFAISVEDYMVLQFVIMSSCAILGVMLGVFLKVDTIRIIMYFFGGAFAAYAIIRYIVAARVTSRKAAMEKQLPDMLDLLSVSVEAGIGFERALQHVTENLDGPLIDEISVTYREMSMGLSRKQALTLLGERCAVEDITTFTSAVIQAGQLGISIRNVLKLQAAAIRRSRRNKVQEKAAKVSTKILIPMLIFIFPVLFIVLLGPSIITILEQFS